MESGKIVHSVNGKLMVRNIPRLAIYDKRGKLKRKGRFDGLIVTEEGDGVEGRDFEVFCASASDFWLWGEGKPLPWGWLIAGVATGFVVVGLLRLAVL